MKKAFLILAILCVSLGFSQEKKENSIIANHFQKAYNVLDYEAIYNLFSEKHKEVFTLEITKVYFERLQNSRGQLKTFSFSKLENIQLK